MTIMPTSDNVIIQLEAIKQNVTESGIILTSKKVANQISKGTVVAIGTGRILNDGRLIAPGIKENDTVLFNKFAGTEIEIDDTVYLMLKENDILAIIND